MNCHSSCQSDLLDFFLISQTNRAVRTQGATIPDPCFEKRKDRLCKLVEKLVAVEAQAANKKTRGKHEQVRQQVRSGSAGDGQFLQVIHEHLQADVIGEDGSSRLLQEEGNITIVT